MVCIYSDVLINFLRNKPEGIKAIQDIKNATPELITTSVNSFELFKAVNDFSKLDETTTAGFLNNFTILDFDLESSKKAAEIFNTLKEKGELLDFADVMIASICIANNQPLLTENKKHFSRIPELEFH